MHPAIQSNCAFPHPGGDSQFFTVPDTYPNSVTLSSAKFPYLDFLILLRASAPPREINPQSAPRVEVKIIHAEARRRGGDIFHGSLAALA